MPPQNILKIWVLFDALWCNLERKISGFHIEKNYKLWFNDSWFVTLRSKVTTALKETNEETISNHNMGANQT